MSEPRLVLVHASWCGHCTKDPSMESIAEAFKFLQKNRKLPASMADLKVVCWQDGEDKEKPVEFETAQNKGYPFIHVSTRHVQKTFCGGPEKEAFLNEAIYGDMLGPGWTPRLRQLLALSTGNKVSIPEIQQRCLTRA